MKGKTKKWSADLTRLNQPTPARPKPERANNPYIFSGDPDGWSGPSNPEKISTAINQHVVARINFRAWRRNDGGVTMHLTSIYYADNSTRGVTGTHPRITYASTVADSLATPGLGDTYSALYGLIRLDAKCPIPIHKSWLEGFQELVNMCAIRYPNEYCAGVTMDLAVTLTPPLHVSDATPFDPLECTVVRVLFS